ncbi:MAG: outer membrane lipoprotein LolB [Comamonas sp.]|nr:outer membrane lipoprotein LolB [Comamonas sp.]
MNADRRKLLRCAGAGTAAVAAASMVFATAGLVGCAAPQAGVSTVPVASATAEQAELWQGRLGLQVFEADGSVTQSFSASFVLQGSAQQGLLEVFNPLGNQVARLQWQPQGAWLEQGQQRLESAHLADLVQRSLGADVPIHALFAWLQGQQAHAPGWQVDVSRHAQGRIQAQRLQPLPRVQLRLVLQVPGIE